MMIGIKEVWGNERQDVIERSTWPTSISKTVGKPFSLFGCEYFTATSRSIVVDSMPSSTCHGRATRESLSQGFKRTIDRARERANVGARARK
eukprot:3527304-Rhodomonas_salina.3